MGADLYIRSLYDPKRRAYEGVFERAVARRDSLPEGTPQHKAAQEEVNAAWEEMMAEGYFRDPYNEWDVLWKFGLSWSRNIIPLLDATSQLSPEGAQKFLSMLDAREGVFEEEVRQLATKERAYFERAARELREFLKTAIDRGEPIECSL